MPHLAVSRRAFLGGAMALGGAALLGHQAAAQDKRNVVLILTDDQGTVDANCYGASDLATPHIDALAAEGTRFTQFYAPSCVCSPSRAGILTGRYPLHAGVPGNVSSQPGSRGMEPEQVTIAEVMADAGYATAHIGKWHLGYDEDTAPAAQGFEHSFGHMGGCIDNYSHFFYWNGPNQHDLWRNGERVHAPGEFFPRLMVEEAERFMDAHAGMPFFMYFPLNTPHYPLQADPVWLKHYEEQGAAHPRDLYAAFMSTTDAVIGDLMDALERRGLRENTIVIFMSDHGHSVEERTHGGGGSAGPYRAAKFSLFEGGIRVPAIISGPGIPKGEVRGQAAHGCDWLPTIASMTGVPLPLDHPIDGKSLVGVITQDGESPHEVLHWYVGRGEKAQWAVREGPWKLIGNPRDPTAASPLRREDQLFLCNLEQDISEMTNFAEDHPEVVERLMQLHEDWVAAVK